MMMCRPGNRIRGSMVQLDVTHLASIVLGALLGAGALWVHWRSRGVLRQAWTRNRTHCAPS